MLAAPTPGRLSFWPTANRCAIMVNSKENNREATMKRTTLLRVGVVLVVLIGLALALLRWAVSDIDDWKGLALNLVTELVGAALTYTLFELVIGRMEKREAEREAEEKELGAKKADLIAQMGSSVKDVAIAAAEELRRHGWHRDGSLQGAFLPGANLPGASLFNADLQRANLAAANLQGANLGGANLQWAFLVYANLQGANLRRTDLQEAHLADANLQRARLLAANLHGVYLDRADLQGATLSEDTVLPDGTKWTPDTDMARFTDPTHPDFWRPDA